MESHYDRTVAVDPREVKLPRWAQDKLDDMRRLTTESREALAATRLASKPEESEAVLNPHGNIKLGIQDGQGLGKHVLISFKLGRHREIDCRITSDGQWLQLRGESRLTMVSDATNSFRVRVVGRDAA